jgi:succinate dehydrogenase / fumarate reductase cytochrome b subunit
MSKSLLHFASITKKISISIIGLFLSVFLVVHLGINLLILKTDPSAFAAAVEFMGTNPVIRVFEVVLFAAFILHILVAIFLWFQNKQARPIDYARPNESKTSFMSKYMIHTGIIIFIFLILHFIHFYFVKVGLVNVPEGAEGQHDFYNMARNLFAIPLYSGIYILSFLALGFHLNHAIQAGFQSLGLNHTKYTPCIKNFSTIFAVIITLGFTFIPIYLLFC